MSPTLLRLPPFKLLPACVEPPLPILPPLRQMPRCFPRQFLPLRRLNLEPVDKSMRLIQSKRLHQPTMNENGKGQNLEIHPCRIVLSSTFAVVDLQDESVSIRNLVPPDQLHEPG